MLFQTLRQFSRFAVFTDEELQNLVVRGKEVSLHSGAILFREGDPAEGVYVLLEGELEITKRVAGQEVVLRHFSQAPLSAKSRSWAAAHTTRQRYV